MIFEGPLQPKLFYGSMVVCVSQLVDFNNFITFHTHIKGAKEPSI